MSQAVGICVGAMTVSIAKESNEGITSRRIPHEGNVAETLKLILSEKSGARVGITGRKFRRLINAPTIPEPEAVELAFGHVRERYPDIDCIVSAGGESFLAYCIDRKGHVRSVHTGNKCASGTGEFFLQQVRRMGLSLEEAVTLAGGAEPYDVASRCTVFCKSDCTHALNKGIERGRVTAGLCRMMAGKIVELLRAAGAGKALIIGGVSRNTIVMEKVGEQFPDIIVPPEAPYFEALGALRWAAENAQGVTAGMGLIRSGIHSFSRLPTLGKGLEMVTFQTAERAGYDDLEYVLGLDVGSTTTKAVLMGAKGKSIVSSIYLRTDGDPVGASRSCYESLLARIPEGTDPAIVGLGVTGSGRRLAGLHALTETVINEIVAHAAAAVHFDPEVDTIFEIGGQDAKYTFLTNGVPTDYAMNEACSAGTGSFLEESCLESFGLETQGISEVAMAGTDPPDFNDQCSAFISSDIKTAMQEGLAREDIVAGLVYSVCRNYLSRVKGSRRVGRKIFMQGGVCYNRAVAPGMANLCGARIVVPPDPGLMGAFGTALEAWRRIETGAVKKKVFSLSELANREIESLEPFVCSGGREKCDRRCIIARYSINGGIYPFGGACDRFYNLRTGRKVNTASLDMVRVREESVFGGNLAGGAANGRGTVGIPSSLLTNTYFPLYHRFFTDLGFEVVRSGRSDPGGMKAAGSAFCLPVLQSHGHVRDLLDRNVERIFIPHVKGIPSGDEAAVNCTCPLVQGEPYVLSAAFGEDLSDRLLTAVLDFNDPPQTRESFSRLGMELGFSRRQSSESFDRALGSFQRSLEEASRAIRKALTDPDGEETGIVLFGRPYNAFSSLANMGIPVKFSSRGYRVLPHDLLSAAQEECQKDERMYWASGRSILAAARFVREEPGLFGVYITNFSCGPDSFILERFRRVMGDKPFLTLELDAHTADAGVDTRIEAFLDVVQSYRRTRSPEISRQPFSPCRVIREEKGLSVRTGGGAKFPVTDPGVHVLVPSMGDYVAKGLTAALNFAGVRATRAPRPGRDELALGSQCASCKECLPYLLTSGSLRRYVRDRWDRDEILLYLMPEAEGPCRFGLYGEAIRALIERESIENVAVLSPSSANGYQGLPDAFPRRALHAAAIADGLDDIRAGIWTLARDGVDAAGLLEGVEESIFESLATDSEKEVDKVLKEGMLRLSNLKKSGTLEDVTSVLLTGEIYVRKDGFSSYDLVRRLAGEGILVRTSPVLEWLFYIDQIVITGILGLATVPERMALWLRNRYSHRMVVRIQKILELSGFFKKQHLDIGFLLNRGQRLIDPRLTGEAILTVSSTLSEIGDKVHGVISISPFGCMPGRIAEAVIGHRLEKDKPFFSRKNTAFWKHRGKSLSLPFLALETDGSSMSQMEETKLESFIRSAHRLNRELKEMEEKDGKVGLSVVG